MREVAQGQYVACHFPLVGGQATEGAAQRPTLCVAILMESPLTVMIANFFVIFGKPHYPTRLFTSEESALAWIAQMREDRSSAHV